jgi:hypothetical protein
VFSKGQNTRNNDIKVFLWKLAPIWDLQPLNVDVPVEALVPDLVQETDEIYIGKVSDYKMSTSPVRFSKMPRVTCLIFSVDRTFQDGEEVRMLRMDSGINRSMQMHQPQQNSHRGDISLSGEMMDIRGSGERSIWLEKPLDGSSQCLLMRSMWVDGVLNVGPLLHPNAALPFQLRTGSVVSLHQASGTVCIGVYTGPIYILEF